MEGFINTGMETLHRKIESLTRRLADCNRELRDVRKSLRTNEMNAFRKIALTPPTSVAECSSSARKRRRNRAQTPNDFWNLNL